MTKPKELFQRQWEIFAFLLIALVWKWQALSVPIFWDEVLVYARPAHWLVTNGLYRALPGLHPPDYFFGHEPGFSWLIAVALKLFGVHIAVARAVVLALSLTQVYFTYRLGVLLGGRWAGLPAAVAVFAIPTVFAHSTQILADPALAGLGAAACYFACAGEDRKYTWIAPIAAALKETSLAFALPIFALKMIQAKSKKQLSVSLVVRYSLPVLVVIGFFASEKLATGNFSNFPFVATLSLAPAMIFRRALQYGSENLWQIQGIWPITLASALGVLALLWRGSPSRRWAVAFLVSVCLCYWLGISCFTTINSRYFLPVFPLLCALAAGGIASVAGRWAPLLLLAAAGWVWVSVPRYTGTDFFVGTAWEESMQYLDMVEVQRQAIHYLESVHPNARIFATWPVDSELLDPFYGYVQKPMTVIYRPFTKTNNCDVILVVESTMKEDYSAQLEDAKKWNFRMEKAFRIRGKTAEIWVKRNSSRSKERIDKGGKDRALRKDQKDPEKQES